MLVGYAQRSIKQLWPMKQTVTSGLCCYIEDFEILLEII